MNRSFPFAFLICASILMHTAMSFNVEIGVKKINSKDSDRDRMERFNPLDPFGDMDMLAKKMIDDFMNMDDFDEDEDEEMVIDEEDEPSTEIKLKDAKNKKTKKHKSSNNKVHKEVFTTVGNGFQTIQITEVHVGHAPGDHSKHNISGMGMPTIIVGKPRNLKIRGGVASPFMMMQQMDDIFESIFESLADKLIEDQLASNLQLRKAVDDLDLKVESGIKTENNSTGLDKSHDDLEIHDEHSHREHIKIKEIKDITDHIKAEGKPEEKSMETQTQAVPTSNEETHDSELAVSFNPSGNVNKGDNVMTAKEKKLQIKEERKRLIFVKICKVVFYIIILFTLFVVGKRLLQLVGLVKNDKIVNELGTITAPSSEGQTLEMKTTNIKSE